MLPTSRCRSTCLTARATDRALALAGAAAARAARVERLAAADLAAECSAAAGLMALCVALTAQLRHVAGEGG